jgi:molybdenum cofactor synthesis domain-containing protein
VDPIRIAILTVSDGVTAGTRADRGGAEIVSWAQRGGHVVTRRESVPDETDRIAAALTAIADAAIADIVITTGGTGLTARDVTPEATRAVIEREASGIAEAIRHAGAESTPFAWLSRGIAGTRAGVLIVNLPGSVGGVRDGLSVLDRVARHAVQLLRGIDTSHHESVDA